MYTAIEEADFLAIDGEFSGMTFLFMSIAEEEIVQKWNYIIVCFNRD